MGHSPLPIEMAVTRRIAMWSLAVESLALFVLHGVPIDTGFPPGTNPVLVWLSAAVVLLHFPALVIGFHLPGWSPISYGWWLLTFLTGYGEITLASILIYRTVKKLIAKRQ